jgi:hypothetical protein
MEFAIIDVLYVTQFCCEKGGKSDEMGLTVKDIQSNGNRGGYQL